MGIAELLRLVGAVGVDGTLQPPEALGRIGDALRAYDEGEA